MTLPEIRILIDKLDPEIRSLLMKRMDYSAMAAEAKLAAGETDIYRADREKAILERLGRDVPEDRLPEYLSVAKKIMEAYNNALHEEMKSNYLFFGFCLNQERYFSFFLKGSFSL